MERVVRKARNRNGERGQHLRRLECLVTILECYKRGK